jgi:hypothetical protein
MNTKIKTIPYSGSLWRADKNSSRIYSNTNIKYFALTEPEIQTYVEKAHRQYKKHWVTKDGEKLNLVDILDLRTRKALEMMSEMSKEALNFSFPIRNNKVLRESDFKPDDTVLRGLCRLGYDGYFMKNINNNKGNYVFHSEIGLCKGAFSKIKLEEIITNKSVAPAAPNKKKHTVTRRNYNNNNNNTRRRPRFTLNNNNNFPRGSLF